MAKNRFLVPSQNHPTPSRTMSTPHSYTVDDAGASQASVLDEDDSDICPVCDGMCTCHPSNPDPLVGSSQQSQITPSSSQPPSLSSSIDALSHSSIKSSSLKIKLTIPSKPSSSNTDPSTKDDITHPNASPFKFYHPTLNPTGPKRRGRPPKALVAAREAAERAVAVSTPPQPSHHPQPQHRGSHRPSTSDISKRKNLKKPPAAGATNPRSRAIPSRTSATTKAAPKPPKKNKATTARPSRSAGTTSQRRGTIQSSYSADREDNDSTTFSESRSDLDDFDDNASGRFPTFVSASALSSSENDSDSHASSSSSSSSGFDTDSSVEAEEELFIREQTKNKKRTRRELFGDDWTRKQHRKSWIIRPRQLSVGASDVEMTVDNDDDDSEATVDDEEEDADVEEDEEEDEEMTGILLDPLNGYVGLATGWSEDEDEEDTFDADLFFANLSDSEKEFSDNDSSSIAGQDEDAASDDIMQVDDQHNDHPGINLLPAFEVTEGWDGKLIFTNGPTRDSSHIDFFPLEGHTPAEVSPSQSDEDESSLQVEDGYEQDFDVDPVEGEGDTTDEDLIDHDNRPNERAMKLFAFPPSVSAIDPLSTLSPGHSPSPRNRRRAPSTGSFKVPESPGPADILAGRFVPAYDESEIDDCGDGDSSGAGSHKRRRSSLSSFGSGLPRKGQFLVNTDQTNDHHHHAIIGPSLRYSHVPSPHARSFARRGRGRGMGSSLSRKHDHELHQVLRKALGSRPSSLSAAETFDPPSSSVPSTPDGHAGVESSASDAPIELDDMIDSSFLETEGIDSHHHASVASSSTATRWDFIHVGAYRHGWTSDSVNKGWGPDSPHTTTTLHHHNSSSNGSSAELGGIIKSSPLSKSKPTSLLWQNRNPSSANHHHAKSLSSSTSGSLSALVSPVLYPIAERMGSMDGDKTPTIGHGRPGLVNNRTTTNSLPCTPKNNKKERNFKRKQHTHPHQKSFPKQNSNSRRPRSQHHQFHHHHGHHPNNKSRSSGSGQRGGFGIPPLSI